MLAKISRGIQRSMSELHSKLPDEWYWTRGARCEEDAMKTTIGTIDPKLFDKRGAQLAEELKAKILPNSVVLDFGCGIGRPEKFLAPYCKKLYGVDSSVGMIKLAQKRHVGIENIHFVKNRKRGLPVFKNDFFDFVFSEAVFQHMDKERATLLISELYRVLKKGGKVYLNFPNFSCINNLEHFIKMSMEWDVLTPYRMRYWLLEEVRLLMEEIGFQIISLETRSDFRDANQNSILDGRHRNYSIWILGSKN